ncbi:hypothetical protein BX666DRAFT_1867361 [Dichotomocladium elegans]|nr:hypothetical protein BX666DRAFT_1867361 [Dichotomocladium elegans]
MAEPRSPGAISTTSFMSSFSWVAEKSSNELTALLKKAYQSLREKERGKHTNWKRGRVELEFIPEIGNSLLENNTTLKSRYEELLAQINEYERQHNDSANESEYDGSDNGATMRLISSQRAHEAHIEELKQENAEMEIMLEKALKESAETGIANERHARNLEKEIEFLRSTLDDAAQKIEELETQKQRGRQGTIRTLATPTAANTINSTTTNVTDSNDMGEDIWLAQELTEKMMQIEAENEQLAYAKRAIEGKLANALADLEQLRHQFGEFQFTKEGYDNLQEAYHRQFKHIEELNSSLEDHRTILARLRERGIRCGHATQPHPFEELRMTTPKQSLLHELENAWLKTHNPQPDGTDYENPASLANENRIVPSVSSQRQHSHYAAYNLYPSASTPTTELLVSGCRYYRFRTDDPDLETCVDMPSSFIGCVLWFLQSMLRVMWRWCRFSVVLLTAILINLWQGPDAIMEK